MAAALAEISAIAPPSLPDPLQQSGGKLAGYSNCEGKGGANSMSEVFLWP